MWRTNITPSFYDTDALQHISNVAMAIWFENARRELFTLFTPDLSPQKWRLIMANLSIDFHAQVYFEFDVEIRTSIKKIGNKSFTCYQELYQKDTCCASCGVVLICYDHAKQQSEIIPEDIKNELSKHLTAT